MLSPWFVIPAGAKLFPWFCHPDRSEAVSLVCHPDRSEAVSWLFIPTQAKLFPWLFIPTQAKLFPWLSSRPERSCFLGCHPDRSGGICCSSAVGNHATHRDDIANLEIALCRRGALAEEIRALSLGIHPKERQRRALY
jgi:hypothetical protein